MPTYDYRCERTGEMFEIWQSFSDDALSSCPRHHDGDEGDICGAPVKKVFSKVGISFKGDGFYKNDHGANASGRKADSGSSSDTSGSGSSSGTSGSGSSSDTSGSGSSSGTSGSGSSGPSSVSSASSSSSSATTSASSTGSGTD